MWRSVASAAPAHKHKCAPWVWADRPVDLRCSPGSASAAAASAGAPHTQSAVSAGNRRCGWTLNGETESLLRENREAKRRTAVQPAPRWIQAGEVRSMSILPALAMSTQYGTLARAITVDDGYLRWSAAAASYWRVRR